MKRQAVVHGSRRLIVWALTVLTVLTLGASVPVASASADLFNNFNTAGVLTGPSTPPLFGIGSPAQITELVTYHWNQGLGATPGSISLRSSTGQMFGPFRATGQSGQGGRANVTWVAATNVTIPAGFYTVLDSAPNTRSYNAQSGYRHFAIVRGTLLAQAAPTPAAPRPAPTPTVSSPCPVSYPNCTCRGAGCAHPDLTAVGGDGPSGFGPSVHKSFAPNSIYAKWDLGPSQTVALLSSYCTNTYRGHLLLSDDEPWYYWFSGYYSKFVCAR